MIRIETRQLLSPIDVAKRLGVTKRRVLYIVDEGKLPAITDSSGRRTFRVEDVEQLLRERQHRKARA